MLQCVLVGTGSGGWEGGDGDKLKKKQLHHVAFRKQLCSWIVVKMVIRDTFVGRFFFSFFKRTLAALVISLWR